MTQGSFRWDEYDYEIGRRKAACLLNHFNLINPIQTRSLPFFRQFRHSVKSSPEFKARLKE
jgi:hypothetical protein